MLCTCTDRVTGWTALPDDPDTSVCGSCHLPSPTAEVNRVGLIYFQDGPLHDQVYQTKDVVTAPIIPVDTLPGLHDYKWTSDFKISERTGAQARIWVYAPAGNTAPAANPPAGTTQEEGRGSLMSTPTTERDTALLERRKALGLKRPEVAEKAGISVAVLASAESGGPRRKQEHVDAITRALDEFESSAAPAGSSPEA